MQDCSIKFTLLSGLLQDRDMLDTVHGSAQANSSIYIYMYGVCAYSISLCESFTRLSIAVREADFTHAELTSAAKKWQMFRACTRLSAY